MEGVEQEGTRDGQKMLMPEALKVEELQVVARPNQCVCTGGDDLEYWRRGLEE